jgi:DNA-binding NtrC family response regulator
MTTSAKVTMRDLPMPVRQGGTTLANSPSKWAAPKAERYNLHEHETQLILQALDETGGNITHAAKKLGISRRTLHRKINELKLRQPATPTTDPPSPHGL